MSSPNAVKKFYLVCLACFFLMIIYYVLGVLFTRFNPILLIIFILAAILTIIPSKSYKKPILRVLNGLLIVIFSTAAIMITLELSARIARRVLLIPRLQSSKNEQKSSPVNAHLPYDPAMCRAEKSVAYIDDPELDFWIPTNLETNCYNYVDHKRVTTNQPEKYKHTIYVFGGSTVMELFCPDDYTFSSYLQREVNQAFPNTYQVTNMGVMGYAINNQYARLTTVDLNPGDIVIFFDGFNNADRLYYICLSQENRTILPSKIFPEINANYLNSFVENELQDLQNQMEQLYRTSDFALLLLEPRNFSPKCLQDESQLTEYAESWSEDYSHHLVESHAYTVSHNATFIHYIQPTIYNIQEPSRYENGLLRSPQFSPAGFEETYMFLYDHLYLLNQAWVQEGILSYDISDAFNHDKRQPDYEIFYDLVHVNWLGNQMLAEAIYEKLYPVLVAQMP